MTRAAGLPGNRWPSRADEQLLRTILARDGSTTGWGTLRSGFDLDRLPVGWFALMPHLAPALTELDPQSHWLPRLRGIGRMTWYESQVAYQTCADAIAAMATAGIEAMLVGDAAVAMVQQESPRQLLNRIEVLVDPGDVARADAALRETGWSFPGGRRGLGARLERGRVSLDLYGSLPPELWPSEAAQEPFSAVRERGVLTAMRGQAVLCPTPTESLLSVAATGLTAPPYRRLVWIEQAFSLSRAVGIDWDGLAKAGARRRGGQLVGTALSYLQRLGLDVPGQVIPTLTATPAPLRVRTGIRLMLHHGRWSRSLGTSLGRELLSRSGPRRARPAARVTKGRQEPPAGLAKTGATGRPLGPAGRG